MTEAVAKFLQSLAPLHERGEVTEELRDLTATVTVETLARGQTGAVLAAVLEHPGLVSDCSIDLELDGRSEPLFRITGRGVRLQRAGFDELADRTTVSGARYHSDLVDHNNAGREGELLFGLVSLLHEVEAATPYGIDCAILINKAAILERWMAAQDDWSVEPAQVQCQFWYDIANLREWVETQPLATYAAAMFDPEQLPMLVYHQNGTDLALTGTELFPVAELTETPALAVDRFEAYRQKMTVTQNNTAFLQGAPVLSPAPVAHSDGLRTLFRETFLYAVYAVFADRVTRMGEAFRFTVAYGPNAIEGEEINIPEQAAALSAKQRAEVADLYQELSRREDREKFVEFWRRSLLQNCSTFTALVDNLDGIRQSYQFIETEVIETNFDELSDAVRDTNVFMTEITAQVSETTAALSDEIQRLVFALLGAIIANLFLILRWSNFDTVIPFSLFVISAILLFYFPLIDRRIRELEEMTAKGQRDYDTYKDLIAGFTGQAFDFQELEERKDDYTEYAEQRVTWAKRKVRQIHAALLATGFVFVVGANAWYPVDSVQVWFSGAFVLTSLALTVQGWMKPDSYSYYRLSIPAWLPGSQRGVQATDTEASSKRVKNPAPAAATVGSLLVVLLHVGGALP